MRSVVNGRYELVRELGTPEGPSEAWWLAFDPDGYSYMVKLWRFDGLEPDPLRRALWDEELRTLYRVASSPGAEESVVRLRDAAVDRKAQAFVMVLASAGYDSLADLLAAPADVPWIGQRSLAQRGALWRGLRTIALGLRLLHGQHVLHRAVDARHVLVDRLVGVDSIRLSGFEWSIRLGSPTSRRLPSDSWGTPPEMSQSSSGYRPETDWFGFGMLAARLLLNVEDLAPLESVERHGRVLERVTSARPTQLAPVEIELVSRLIALRPHDRLVHSEDILRAVDNVIAALTSDSGVSVEQSSLFLVVDPKMGSLLDVASQAGFVLDPAVGDDVFNPLNDDHVAQLTSFLRGRLESAQLLAMDDGGTYALVGAMKPLRIGPFSDMTGTSWDMAFCIGPCEVHTGRTDAPTRRLPLGSVHLRALKQVRRDPSIRGIATTWERVLPQDSLGPPIGRHLADFLEFLRLTNQIDLVIRDAEVFPYAVVSMADDGIFERVTIVEATRTSQPPRWCQVESGLHQFLSNELATNKPECEVVVLTAEPSLLLGWIDRQDRWTIHRINEDGPIELVRPIGAGTPPPESGFIRTWGMAAGQIPLIRRRSDAIERLASHSYLLQALTAPGRVYMDTGEADLAVVLPEAEVDEPKRACIEDVLRVRPIYALQGPPGTGKTTMVAWLLREILSDDPVAQILVTAQAHGAVDVLRQKVTTEVFADLPDDEKPLAVRLRPDDRRGEEGGVEVVALDMLRRTAVRLREEDDRSDLQEAWLEEVDRMTRALDNLASSDAAPDFCQVVRRAANLTYCTTSAGDLEVIARDNQSFDWSIVEEAGKAHGFDLALPLLAGHRWLLIGDHKQLPPYRYDNYLEAITDLDGTIDRLADLRSHAAGLVDSDLLLTWENKSDEERTRFKQYASSRLATFHQVFRQCGTAPGTLEPTLTLDRATGAAAGMLSGQHRMHPDIGELISEVFYGGRVQNRTVGSGGAPLERVMHGFDSPSEIAGRAIVWLDVPSATRDPAFAEVGPRQGMPRYTNPAEAQVLKRFLERLGGRRHGEPLTFAALSPYNRQVQRLREVLRDVSLPAGGLVPISDLRGRPDAVATQRIGHTVDAFQGNQADVVAVSLVRNNDYAKEHGLGFLEDRSRINVLLSRAERLLVLIGSWDFFVDQSSLVDLGDETDLVWHWAKVTRLLDEWFGLGRAVRIDAVAAGLI